MKNIDIVKDDHWNVLRTIRKSGNLWTKSPVITDLLEWGFIVHRPDWNRDAYELTQTGLELVEREDNNHGSNPAPSTPPKTGALSKNELFFLLAFDLKRQPTNVAERIEAALYNEKYLDRVNGKLVTTDKARALIDAMLKTPEPIATWSVPTDV